MRAPEFWSRGGRRAIALEALLAPIAFVYERVAAARVRRVRPAIVSRPVICVGNVSLGGVGKTPVARALARRFRDAGVDAHVVSRGYGGAQSGPLRVDPAVHTARDVGDEPLLHAADGPAWIARDRVAGARAAIGAGAHAIILDDGFQNPALAKDLSILVFDAAAGIGNGRVFPSGPLREPLGAALARCDLAIVMGAGETPWLEGFAGPVVRARLTPVNAPPAGKLVAFAGIGAPEKFFATLRAAGAQVDEEAPFPDHHVFTTADQKFLDRLASERDARLITTEKDFARLPAPWRAHVATLNVAATFDDDARIDAALAPSLARAREAR
jgi:tetraacyldisaccharide 4'-kinase